MTENMRGTLTSSGSNFVHTLTFTIFLYKSCTMTISKYSEPFYLENYARVVIFEPNLQRALLHDITDFLLHSTTAKFLPLYTHTRILSEPQDLATVKGSPS